MLLGADEGEGIGEVVRVALREGGGEGGREREKERGGCRVDTGACLRKQTKINKENHKQKSKQTSSKNNKHKKTTDHIIMTPVLCAGSFHTGPRVFHFLKKQQTNKQKQQTFSLLPTLNTAELLTNNQM